MKAIFIIALSFLSPLLTAQTIVTKTISGYVKEAISGESLIGANISSSDHMSGTVTNSYGFYSLTIKDADSVELTASYVGYLSKKINLSLREDIIYNFELTRGTLLNEVIVNSENQERQSESVKMSSIKIPVHQIQKVPTLLGEKDVLKVIQLMPGVQKGAEGSSGFYVRGGGPDQNLIILDDAVVYNASHLFGFFSVFNGDAIRSVELTKGGFPARFGGRLSSVLEMRMKEGNKEEWHFESGIGLISGKATIEGPIKKGKSSLLISGRRTFADLITMPIKGLPNYHFYDLNAKINFDINQKNKLFASIYLGQDRNQVNTRSEGYIDNSGFNWGNSTGTLRWNHLFSNKMFSNTSLIFSRYGFAMKNKSYDIKEEKKYYAEYYSGIKDISLKYDIDYIPDQKHWIRVGIVTTKHIFNPYAFVEQDELYEKNTQEKTTIKGNESGLYAEDTWHPFESLRINAGLRMSHFVSERKQHLFPEPRFSISFKVNNSIALKGSYSIMNQYIHLLSNTGVGLPTDLWVPVTEKIKPQQSQQLALGVVKDIEKNNLSFSLEAYYKTMNNVIAYKEGASFIAFEDAKSAASQNWESKVTIGKSWSYGVELFLQKSIGRLNGWIGYTLSWTPMQFDSLNFGKKFYARYDRRNDISIVTFYKLSEHINLSGSWVFGTGNAITLARAIYNAPADSPDLGSGSQPFNYNNNWGKYAGFDYGEKNNFRIAPYHRLDLGIQFSKEKKCGVRTFEISLYNVYNRMNPYYYYFATKIVNGKEYRVLRQVTLFPFIPSFSYNIKF